MLTEIFQSVLKIALILFMVGSLGGMGLELALRDAFAAIRNVRFVGLALFFGFVFCPGIAYLVAKLMPMHESYGVGLILLGMAPSAPFMPMMVKKAGGDLAYTAAFMLIAAVGTVFFMPVAAPLMIKGLSAGAWTIGRPLLLFVLLPLVLGSALKALSEDTVSRLYPVVKKITDVVTVVMLVSLVIIYGKGFLASIGTFAIASQVVFIGIVTVVAFCFSSGLNRRQRAVLGIGLCTRNIGAAFAPLLAMKADPRSTIMLALAVPVTILLSYLAARWFGREAKTARAVAFR